MIQSFVTFGYKSRGFGYKHRGRSRIGECMKPYSTFCFLKEHPEVKNMAKNTQHKNTDTYSHCRHVALRSVWLVRHMGIDADMEAVIKGAMLHDFSLHEVKQENYSSWKCARLHPEAGLSKAEKIFDLNWKEKNIIYSHMWPIRIAHVPKCREAVIVNVADKMCAIEERFMWKKMDVKISKEEEFLRNMEEV